MVADHDESARVELFGGAFSFELPTRFDDLSAVRQVPDTQEAFTDVRTDQSVIVEILGTQQDVATEDVAAYHLNELARTDEAVDGASVEPLPPFPIDALRESLRDKVASVTCALGTQHIAKFNEDARNTVQVFIAVLRVPAHDTELLLTLNNPIEIAAASSSAKSVSPDDAALRVPLAEQLFERLLSSFDAHDWSILEC